MKKITCFFKLIFLCLKNQYLVDVYTRGMLVYLNILNFFLTHCSQLLNNNRINMFYSQRVVTVFCQFILLSNFFVTMAALIRFIPIIHYLIVNQITIMCKIFFTMVVFICFFLSVYFLMSFPITILTKKNHNGFTSSVFHHCVCSGAPRTLFLNKPIITMAAFLRFTLECIHMWFIRFFLSQ